MLTEDVLKSGLKTHHFGTRIYTFESIDSTNNCARALAACGAAEGTVIIAEEQTDGKGRMGRAWVTTPGDNLLFSIVLRPPISPERLNLVPFCAANAVADAVERLTDLRVDCKWPNDLLIGKKKFSGILIEGSIKKNIVEYIVIGIGINVNQPSFPEALCGKATSLMLEAGRAVDRTLLFQEALFSLETGCANLAKQNMDAALSRWLNRTPMLNKPVSVFQEGTTITGVMKGLSDEGGLVVDTNGGEKVFMAGDATILRE